MPHVATMGTSSCATISIGGFKNTDSYQQNEDYKADKTAPVTEGLSVDQFYSQILYPVSQPLGRSRDLPFTKLMEDIENSSLSSKLIMATLNQSQYLAKGRYLHNELKEWGFELIRKCDNVIGSVNYVYMRNPSNIEIKEGEA